MGHRGLEHFNHIPPSQLCLGVKGQELAGSRGRERRGTEGEAPIGFGPPNIRSGAPLLPECCPSLSSETHLPVQRGTGDAWATGTEGLAQVNGQIEMMKWPNRTSQGI